MSMQISVGQDIPPEDTPDETPPVTDPPVSVDFDPDYPGSTPDAPYGFKPDGTPYLRRPNGAKRGTTRPDSRPGKLVATDSQAKAAAAMLGSINSLVGLSLAFMLPTTALELKHNNDQFEAMAYEALRTDPALCRKILSAGSSSGKTALIMAYASLGMSVAPVAFTEIKEKRNG